MTLTKFNGNIPFICKVEYVPVSDVVTFFRKSDTEAIITLQDNTSWRPFYGTPSSYQFKDKKDNTSAGSLYNNELLLYYPGDDTSSLSIFKSLDKLPVFARITFSDEKLMIIGNMDEPAFISQDFESATKTGFICSIKCTSIERFRFETV